MEEMETDHMILMSLIISHMNTLVKCCFKTIQNKNLFSFAELFDIVVSRLGCNCVRFCRIKTVVSQIRQDMPLFLQ